MLFACYFHRSSAWAAVFSLLLNGLLALLVFTSLVLSRPLADTHFTIGTVELPMGCYRLALETASLKPTSRTLQLHIPRLAIDEAADCQTDTASVSTSSLFATLAVSPLAQAEITIDQLQIAHPALQTELSVALHTQLLAEPQLIAMSGQVEGQINTAGSDITVNLKIPDAALQPADLTWHSDFELNAQGEWLLEQQSAGGELTARGKLSGRLPEQTSVLLERGARFDLQQLSVDDIQLNGGYFQTTTPLALELPVKNHKRSLRLQSQDVSFRYQASKAILLGGSHSLSLSRDGQRLRHQHSLSLRPTESEKTIAQLDISADSKWPAQSMSHDVALDWQLPDVSNSKYLPLAGNWLTEQQVTLHSGQAIGQLSLTANNQRVEITDIQAELKRINARLQTLELEGFTSRLAGPPERLRLVSPVVLWQGAMLKADWLPLVPQPGLSRLAIYDLSLGLLAEFYPKVIKAATGTVNVSIPLRYQPDGVVVSDGKLIMAERGCMQLDEVLIARSGNASRNSAFDWLSYLCFDHLSSDFTLSPDGELDLKARIEGKNPGRSRALRLNYSHQENLLQLWRSYRLATSPSRKLPALPGGEP